MWSTSKYDLNHWWPTTYLSTIMLPSRQLAWVIALVSSCLSRRSIMLYNDVDLSLNQYQDSGYMQVLINGGGGSVHCQVEHHVPPNKIYFMVICITKMGWYFINFFSWVDIHRIYYIVKNGNQNWGCIFLIKHTVSN